MIRTRSFTLAVAVVAAGLTVSAGVARADDQSARVAALEARLAQLEAQQSKADQAIAQSKAIDAAIIDADKKGQFLLDDGFTSGWDNGFKIGSADGNYLVQPYVEFQFRNTTNYTGGDDNTGAGDDSNDSVTNGFEVRRLKVGLKGNAFNKDFTYNFRFSVDRSTGTTAPDYAYVQYQFADDWAVKLGQFKLNWTHEQTMSDTKQLTVERSLLDQVLGGGNSNYVQGVSLLYGNKDKPFRGEVQFTDGENTANTNYTDNNATAYQDFGVGVRGEYKFFGKWADYEDFSARKDAEDLLVAGGGVDYAEGGDGDVYRLTADLQYENTNGLNAYGSAIYTIADDASTAVLLDKSIGGLAQVGYLLPSAKDWEVFGRYSILHLDETVDGEDNFHEVTVGVNKFYYGHNAKLTIDAGWLPNGTPAPAGGLGVTNDTENQIVVRAQFQLLL